MNEAPTPLKLRLSHIPVDPRSHATGPPLRPYISNSARRKTSVTDPEGSVGVSASEVEPWAGVGGDERPTGAFVSAGGAKDRSGSAKDGTPGPSSSKSEERLGATSVLSSGHCRRILRLLLLDPHLELDGTGLARLLGCNQTVASFALNSLHAAGLLHKQRSGSYLKYTAAPGLRETLEATILAPPENGPFPAELIRLLDGNHYPNGRSKGVRKPISC